MLKISFSPDIWLGQPTGGISRYFIELARGFRTRGHSANLSAPIHRNTLLYESGINPHSLYLRRSNREIVSAASRVNQLAFARDILNSPPDLIHETYYAKKRMWSPAQISVTTVHDMIPEIFFPADSVVSDEVHRKKVSVQQADLIVCVSETTRRDLVTLIPEAEDRSVVIHHGVSPIFFGETAELEKPLGRPYLLYVGQRGGHKNFSRLAEAYALSNTLRNDFALMLFGGGRLTAEERANLSALKIDPESIISVSGDDAALKAAYSNAAALVYPSTYEGFGLPPLEASASGCPVFASNIGVIQEVMSESAVYFSPGDSEDLQSTLEHRLYDSQFMESMRDSGKRHARLFSWDRCVEETLSAYGSVA